MRLTIFCICVLLCLGCYPQGQKTRNIFIVTTDGFRWEEIFKGADSSLVRDTRYVEDTSLTKEMFWDSTVTLRRQKLMPFLWNIVSRQGQIYGNRLMNNKVNVKNFYKISYSGYSEILTGFADPVPILNIPVLKQKYQCIGIPE